MSPFEPVGHQARWRTIYTILTSHEVDDIVTYDEIADALEVDPLDDRHIIQMSMRRAAKEHEEADLRALEVVPNVGYRIVEATEHLILARRHQKKSNKALQRGQSKVVNVDFTGMEPEVRKAFEVTANAFGSMIDMQRRMYKRQSSIEATLEETSNRQDRSDDEVEALKERLAGIEKRLNPDD